MKDAKRIARQILREYKPPKGLFRFYADRSWLPQIVILEATDLKVPSNIDVTFENVVFTDPERIRQMMKPLRDINYTIWPRGSWDEAYIMAEHKIPAFTLGLPLGCFPNRHLGDVMHDYDAFTTTERISKYRRVLQVIDKEFK